MIKWFKKFIGWFRRSNIQVSVGEVIVRKYQPAKIDMQWQTDEGSPERLVEAITLKEIARRMEIATHNLLIDSGGA